MLIVVEILKRITRGERVVLRTFHWMAFAKKRILSTRMRKW